ncbi:MAG: TauD/TfdA family dioxygenase [Roseomonas sp.]|jgi:alpha-ketoglutarate-dependent taurine dioxygenase|nr:TauD/TfdA family dioxygenase [Roseomonas sp.]
MMRVRPLHPAFGLEITDIRLDTESPSALIAELRRQLARSEALLLRGQDISTELQLRLVESLSAESHSAKSTSVTVIRSEAHCISLHEADAFWQADRLWHELPSRLSILYVQSVPDAQPAEMLLLSQTHAYEELNSWLRWHIEYLEVEHRARPVAVPEANSYDLPGAHYPASSRTIVKAVYPLVRIDPTTEKRSLFLPETTSHGLLDMPEQAGQELLRRLQQKLLNPNAIHRHVWQTGDLLIWDSARLLHKLSGISADSTLRFARSRPLGEKPLGPRSTAMPWVVAG